VNRQDAIKALVTAGRTSEVEELAKSHGAKAQRAYAQIRQDSTLSDAYRKKTLAVLQLDAQKALDIALEDAARGIMRSSAADAGKVFGVEGLRGDHAALISSRREAGDKVADIANSDDLSAMLRRANRTGDEVLARACAERATEIGNKRVLDEFLDQRPDLDAAANRLWSAQEAAGARSSLGLAGLLGEVRADEFGGMPSDDVERVAYTEPVAPTEPRKIQDNGGAKGGGRPMASPFGIIQTG
jgi:hypothetical protein